MLCVLFLVAATIPAAAADMPHAADEYHPWALFEVGSWKKVRVVTETLSVNGQIESVSTTNTKTTLTAVDESSFTLTVEASVELAGRRFQVEPKVVKQGFYGEQPGQPCEVKILGPGEVTICGRRLPTTIQEVGVGAADGRRITTVQLSDTIAPFVLKGETKTVSPPGAEPASVDSVVEVLAVEMPFRVLTKIKPVAYVRTVQMQKKAVAVSTIEVQCIEVPGAVVSHSSQEFDSAGHVIRRSTLELVDYEIARPVPTTIIPKQEVRRRVFRHTWTRRP